MQIFGHVRWFVEETQVTANKVTGIEALIIGSITAGAVGALHLTERFLNQQRFYQQLVKKANSYHEHANAGIRIILGAILVIASQTQYLLAPNFALDGQPAWIQPALLVFGVLLLVGFMVRDVAVLLFVLFAYLLLKFPAIEVAEHLEYLGLAFYVLAAGPGVWALDNRIKKPQWHLRLKPYALPTLRVLVGISFVLLAFNEKLLNIEMGLHFLEDYHWNFLSVAGFDNHFFVLMAGTIELILGTSLIFNVASRLVILIVASTFALTAVILGLTEVAGHLFGVAVLLAIWCQQPKLAKKH